LIADQLWECELFGYQVFELCSGLSWCSVWVLYRRNWYVIYHIFLLKFLKIPRENFSWAVAYVMLFEVWRWCVPRC
jgi:hypothetical protein